MKQRTIIIASILAFSFSANQDIKAQWARIHGPLDQWIECLTASGSDLFAGDDGLYRSRDSGKNWTAVAGGRTFALAQLGSYLFAGNVNGKVLRSADGGESWVERDSGITGEGPAQGVCRFAVLGPDIFAGTLGYGVFRSSDSGLHWTAINSGLGSTLMVNAMGVKDMNLFVALGSACYRSSDKGSSWVEADPGYYEVRALAASGTTLFAATYGHGVFLSADNGKSWLPTDPMIGEMTNFFIADTQLFAAGDHGLYLSVKGGAGWQEQNTGLTNTNITGVAAIGTNLFVSTSDSGVWRRPLSEMIGANAVAPTPQPAQTLTAYPNPSTQSATISVTSTENGEVEITIVNLLGEEVARLFEGTLEAGAHTFTWEGRGVAPGVYECVARVGGSVERVRVVILR